MPTETKHAKQLLGSIFHRGTSEQSAEDVIWRNFVQARAQFDQNNMPKGLEVPTPLDLIADSNIARPFKERALTEYLSKYGERFPVDLIRDQGLTSKAVELVSTSPPPAVYRNARIVELVPILPEEQAEELISQIQLSEHGWQKYYDPTEVVLESPIDEKWKRRVADRMHVLITNEQAGLHHPADSQDKPTANYLQILSTLLYSDQLKVSERFYEDETRFLLDTVPGELFDLHHIGRVMNMIKAKELRHRFVRRHILTDKFFVYDATLEAAKQIMAEFPEDTELVNHLHQKFQKWEEGELRQAENNKLQAAEVEKKRQALTQAVEAMKIKPS